MSSGNVDWSNNVEFFDAIKKEKGLHDYVEHCARMADAPWDRKERLARFRGLAENAQDLCICYISTSGDTEFKRAMSDCNTNTTVGSDHNRLPPCITPFEMAALNISSTDQLETLREQAETEIAILSSMVHPKGNLYDERVGDLLESVELRMGMALSVAENRMRTLIEHPNRRIIESCFSLLPNLVDSMSPSNDRHYSSGRRRVVEDSLEDLVVCEVVAAPLDCTSALVSRFCESFRCITGETNDVARCVTLMLHGTPERNIRDILSNGLDSECRRRQVHGQGDYFSHSLRMADVYVTSGSSTGIASSTRQVVVVAALVDASCMKSPSGIAVVKNTCHQLPIATIKYSKLRDVLKHCYNESTNKACSKCGASTHILDARASLTIPPFSDACSTPLSSMVVCSSCAKRREHPHECTSCGFVHNCFIPLKAGKHVLECATHSCHPTPSVRTAQSRYLTRFSSMPLPTREKELPTCRVCGEVIRGIPSPGPVHFGCEGRSSSTTSTTTRASNSGGSSVSADTTTTTPLLSETEAGMQNYVPPHTLRLLTRELRKFQGTEAESSPNISVELILDRLDKWCVRLNFAHAAPEFHGILSQYAVAQGRTASVDLEVTFPVVYPAVPPFVRVLWPKFERFSGHVTSEGALCTPLLGSAWDPDFQMVDLFAELCRLIIEGQPSVCPTTRNGVKYSESEARKSFLRVMRAHGWV